MRPITIGATGIFQLKVKPSDLANQFKDSILPQVFATPMMILAMENAALNAIRDYLDVREMCQHLPRLPFAWRMRVFVPLARPPADQGFDPRRGVLETFEDVETFHVLTVGIRCHDARHAKFKRQSANTAGRSKPFCIFHLAFCIWHLNYACSGNSPHF